MKWAIVGGGTLGLGVGLLGGTLSQNPHGGGGLFAFLFIVWACIIGLVLGATGWVACVLRKRSAEPWKRVIAAGVAELLGGILGTALMLNYVNRP